MRGLFTMGLGLLLLTNGVVMLVAAQTWYATVPTVPPTGPFNGHFVRDIGCAYIAGAGALLWMAWDRRAWPAAFAGAVFFALHALCHVWDVLADRETGSNFGLDAVLVILPAGAALWLARPRRFDRKT